MPYIKPIHTVVETKAYIAAAKGAGMSEEEMQAVVDAVAADPEAGAIMQGCGGARKFRHAKPGKGKSGSYRIVTYYGGENIPVFLITVFGKGEKSNLSDAEKKAVAKLTKKLRDEY
ncbi:MAG TPA: type II toxin-antitoxin system RelE/ParE family toxin [Allosphingosinicella sp.]